MNELTPRIVDLPGEPGQRVILQRADRSLSYREVVEGWAQDDAFRSFFMNLLEIAPYEAFFWETPPITWATYDRDFEFVWLESPSLASVRPEPSAFAEHFGSGADPSRIATFWNLGKDALLVAPMPVVEAVAYAHLGAFSRRAPAEQRHALWRSVGAAVAQQLSESPLWLSTAGLGVHWLHLRLDWRPKYYRHAPYRCAP